jgi:hypothetical protein
MFRRPRRDRTLDALAAYRQYQGYAGQTVKAPSRTPGLISDFIVPLAHAFTVGFLVASLWCLLLNHYGDPETSIWLIWLEIFLGAAAVGYMLATFAVWKLLWAAFEQFTNRDLDGDGQIGNRPIIKGRRDTGSNKGIGGKVADRADVEAEEAPAVPTILTPRQINLQYPFVDGENTMQWFVRVCAETTTSSRMWEPVVGRKRYQGFRDALIGAGWARWNSYDDNGQPLVNTGWVLDVEAEAICQQITNL